MFWELVLLARNPIGLVKVKGASRRQNKPFMVTVEQFDAVSGKLEGPHRQMALV